MRIFQQLHLLLWRIEMPHASSQRVHYVPTAPSSE
jgi:hypothetical protein